jgi:hypothetical protein
MPLVIGHCDGAFYMLGVFKKAFPEAQFIADPGPATRLDFLVYSLFGNQHQKYRNVRKILISGEPAIPGGLGNGASLVVDCCKKAGGPAFYLPFYVTSFFERFQNKPEDLLLPKDLDQYRKTKFCAFLYSQEHEHRNRLYDQVNAYKKTDALGKCRSPAKKNRPTDRQVYRPGICTYNDLAVGHYKPYKFVICAENCALPGYVTEKIVSAMLAGAIPIYWGAPDVGEHFNSRSFINANQEGWFEKLKQVNESPEMYQEMLKEPWLSENRLNSHFEFAEALRERVLAGAGTSAGFAFKQLRKR